MRYVGVNADESRADILIEKRKRECTALSRKSVLDADGLVSDRRQNSIMTGRRLGLHLLYFG